MKKDELPAMSARRWQDKFTSKIESVPAPVGTEEDVLNQLFADKLSPTDAIDQLVKLGISLRSAQKIVKAQLEVRLVDITFTYIRDKHPEWERGLGGCFPTVEDSGDCWKVSFELPSGVLGGSPVVLINKITKEVSRAFHEQ